MLKSIKYTMIMNFPYKALFSTRMVKCGENHWPVDLLLAV